MKAVLYCNEYYFYFYKCNKYYYKGWKPLDDTIKRLENLNTTLLADGMDYENVMDFKIQPVNYKNIIVGKARTISAYPGDNLFIHYAIYEANPGDILVVDGKGAVDSAYIGNLMATTAEALGIKGIIIDGLVRDKGDLSNRDIQIYSKGFTPKGPRKNGPGSFDHTIQCGGVVVKPNDYIVADEDGVIVIPNEDVEKYIKKAEEKLVYENQRMRQIEEFKLNKNSDKSSIEPDWFRETFNKYNK